MKGAMVSGAHHMEKQLFIVAIYPFRGLHSVGFSFLWWHLEIFVCKNATIACPLLIADCVGPMMGRENGLSDF